MQRAGRAATEQQTRASSPSEKSVSPFSRSIEANGAGCQGVWTPRATQQAAPLRSPKAFHLGFLMQLGSTRTRLWNEAEQAGLIRVCTVSNSLEPGFRKIGRASCRERVCQYV